MCTAFLSVLQCCLMTVYVTVWLLICVGQSSGVDPCDDATTCGDGTECVGKGDSFICKCKTGFTNKTKGDKEHYVCKGDVDECVGLSSPCANDELCINTIGSYYCDCPDGFKYHKGTCTDEDECESDKGICGQGTCSNTDGNFTCLCKDGTVVTGHACIDEWTDKVTFTIVVPLVLTVVVLGVLLLVVCVLVRKRSKTVVPSQSAGDQYCTDDGVYSLPKQPPSQRVPSNGLRQEMKARYTIERHPDGYDHTQGHDSIYSLST